MFNHISLGVRDIGKAKAFYDPTMKALGFACLSEDDSALGYGKDLAGLWLLQTESPVPADPKSGLHVCLTAPDLRERRAISRRGAGGRGKRQRQAWRSRRLRSQLLRRLCHRPEWIPAGSRLPRGLSMATIRGECTVAASPEAAWDAIRDVGAVHTRLARGFVTDVTLEPGARVVTFANGVKVREPIVTIDNVARRLVWAAEGGRATHCNASLQVADSRGDGTVIAWVADFLPDSIAPQLSATIAAGMAAIKRTLDAQH